MPGGGFRRTLTALTAGAVISVVIGAGLVGGGSYLLLQRPLDSHQTAQELQHIEESIVEMSRVAEINRTYDRGWFGKGVGYVKLDAVLVFVALEYKTGNYPDAVSPGKAEWCSNAVWTLTKQREAIAASVMQDPEFRAEQASMVAAYDFELTAVRRTANLLYEWHGLSRKARSSAFDSITTTRSRAAAAGMRRSNQMKDVTAHIARQQSELRISREQLDVQRRNLLLKTVFGFAGVVLGIGLLGYVAVSARGAGGGSS